MRKSIFFLFLLILAACAPTSEPTLTVFAAASLTNAFTEIGTAFERTNPGVKVAFNFAGSQELRTQIEQGARADVFASADAKHIDDLKSKGLMRGDARVFAHNRLIVIAPKNNPAGIQTLHDLAKPGVKLVLADASVPIGNYSLQVLDKLSMDTASSVDFKARVLARVVSRENNARQVVGKVSLGEADAGIVYATDAQSAAGKLITIEIPDSFNVVAIYPIVILKESANAAFAEKFSAFVLSSEGQMILKQHGFATP